MSLVYYNSYFFTCEGGLVTSRLRVKIRRIGRSLYVRIPNGPNDMIGLQEHNEGRFGLKRPADDVIVLTYRFKLSPKTGRVSKEQ